MLGKCVGTGSSCEVYEWGGDDKVVKLFHTNTPFEAVQLEYRNSNAAWKSGLPIARPYEQVIWDGRPGIIFEKIVGETIVNRLFEQLYTFRKIDFNDADSDLRIFARVLNDIHKATIFDIVTNQKENLKAIIGRSALFTNDEILAIHSYIDRLPVKRQLCHGDTNGSNLILRDGIPVMIDWMHASLGNPAADVAEVCVMIEYAVLPPETPEEEVRSWYVPAAARSIASGAIPDEQIDKLAAMIRHKLCLA